MGKGEREGGGNDVQRVLDKALGALLAGKGNLLSFVELRQPVSTVRLDSAGVLAGRRRDGRRGAEGDELGRGRACCSRVATMISLMFLIPRPSPSNHIPPSAQNIQLSLPRSASEAPVLAEASILSVV